MEPAAYINLIVAEYGYQLYLLAREPTIIALLFTEKYSRAEMAPRCFGFFVFVIIVIFFFLLLFTRLTFLRKRQHSDDATDIVIN